MSVNTDCSVAPAPVHGVVVFEPAAFKILYPTFAAVSDATLLMYFTLATMILGNTCRSVVMDANQRETLLNLLVAHITALQPAGTSAGGAGSGGGLVGRITEATEGTVRITAAYASDVSASMAWFTQTQYGAMFWQLTVSYRTMHYIPPSQCCGPAGPYAGRRGY